jgi:hypothetical protein
MNSEENKLQANDDHRSVMHSLMMRAKIISDKDKAEFDHDGLDKRKPKSSKGKGPSLNEKVSGANIKDWVKYYLI